MPKHTGYYPDNWSREDEDYINGRVPRWQRDQVRDDYEYDIEEIKNEIENLKEKLIQIQAEYDNFLEANYA